MKHHNFMVADLTGQSKKVLSAGANAVRAVDCEVGSTVTLLFGVYRVELVGGHKQFVKQRDLSEVEQVALGQNVRVQKPACGGIRW